MSSMFKKKTGPSIKPKFVPRGRPAAPSATPAPLPAPSAAAAASSTPQPTKDVEAPTRRVPSPRVQRRVSASDASKTSQTSPRQTQAEVASDQAPTATTPRNTRSHPTERSTPSIQPTPQATRVTTSEHPHALIPKISQSLDQGHSLPVSTQAQQPAIPSTSTSTHTDVAPPQGEKNLPANSTTSSTPQPSTTIRPSRVGQPTPSTQPAAPTQSTSNEPPAAAQTAAGTAPKATPTRRPRKRPAAPATPNQQESEGPMESIEPGSQPVKRARQRKTQPQTETPDGTAEDAQPKPKRQRRKRQTEGEEGGEREAQRRQNRARSGTPPGAEDEVVDIQQMKMSDLTRDLRIGKKFSRHDELRDRERQDRARRSADPKASQTPAPQTPSDARPSPGASGPTPMPAARAPAGPQFQIVNGQIVVDQSSLVMDRHARDAIDGPIEEIEENEFTHKVTSNSYRTGSKLRGPNHWSSDDTEKFYEYLAMHGTDFSIITSLFPGRQRRHIKMKFNREEKFNRGRVDAALIGPKKRTMGFEEYRKATGREYDLTEDVQAELDRDNEEREAALRAKEEADARENQQRLEAIHGTRGENEAAEKEGSKKK